MKNKIKEKKGSVEMKPRKLISMEEKQGGGLEIRICQGITSIDIFINEKTIYIDTNIDGVYLDDMDLKLIEYYLEIGDKELSHIWEVENYNKRIRLKNVAERNCVFIDIPKNKNIIKLSGYILMKKEDMQAIINIARKERK